MGLVRSSTSFSDVSFLKECLGLLDGRSGLVTFFYQMFFAPIDVWDLPSNFDWPNRGSVTYEELKGHLFGSFILP
jgi:hypothetical protein